MGMPRRPGSCMTMEPEQATTHDPSVLSADRPDDGPAWEPTARVLVTPLLLTLNCVVFAVMVVMGVDRLNPEDRVVWGGAYGYLTLAGEWWRLLTALFVHGGVLHILINMVFLWKFGRIVECWLGSAGVLVVYLVSGLVVSMVYVIERPDGVGAGASGAIFGLFGAAVVLFFRHREAIHRGSARGAIIWAIGFAGAYLPLNPPPIHLLHGIGMLTGLACCLLLSFPSRPHPASGRAARSLYVGLGGLALVACLAWLAPNPKKLLEDSSEALAGGRHADALKDHDRLIDWFPKYWHAYLKRGIFHAAIDDLEGAIRDYDRAIQLNPRDHGVYLYRGFARFKLGEMDRAGADWRRAAQLEAAPEDKAASLENIGLIHLRMGHWTRALELTEIINAIHPDLAWNALIRAIAADRLGRPEVARRAHRVWLAGKEDVAVGELKPYLAEELWHYLTVLPE